MNAGVSGCACGVREKARTRWGERAQIRTLEENKKNSSQKNLYY